MKTAREIEVGYSFSGHTMFLSGPTTLVWDQESGGRALRDEVRRDAQVLADTLDTTIEIESSDGITLDAVSPEYQSDYWP